MVAYVFLGYQHRTPHDAQTQLEISQKYPHKKAKEHSRRSTKQAPFKWHFVLRAPNISTPYWGGVDTSFEWISIVSQYWDTRILRMLYERPTSIARKSLYLSLSNQVGRTVGGQLWCGPASPLVKFNVVVCPHVAALILASEFSGCTLCVCQLAPPVLAELFEYIMQ